MGERKQAFAVIVLAAAIVALASVASSGTPAEHREMRELYLEYKQFSNTPEFRAQGFRIGGPFETWHERVQTLSRSPYGKSLIVECNVVPADLLLAATAARKGQRDKHRSTVERDFERCFK